MQRKQPGRQQECEMSFLRSTTKWRRAAKNRRGEATGRQEDEGNPPVIAETTWGPTGGPEAHIKVTRHNRPLNSAGSTVE